MYILHQLQLLNPQGEPCVKQITIVMSSASPDPGNSGEPLKLATGIYYNIAILIYPFYVTITL